MATFVTSPRRRRKPPALPDEAAGDRGGHPEPDARNTAGHPGAYDRRGRVGGGQGNCANIYFQFRKAENYQDI